MNFLLDEVAAAEVLRLQPKTLCRWRWEGRGPAYVKVGGAIRYRIADIDEYVARNRVAQNV
ncbi:helix-turn-helix domain-containing protein [Novosphingobium sp.]|uniref:helix-turn-helix transcriptional regulator n=1 Tax=Novosphingobium sp. TaxID=1874826 RepID=UPI00286E4FAB|nr:helix-turn-helix domain-containing protein [Novosphingobium sp.]